MKSGKKLKKSNLKRIKSTDLDDDSNIVKKGAIILIIVILILVVMYFFTEKIHKQKKSENEVTNGSINYNKLSVGMIFNRPESEYYVLVYDADNKDAILYSSIMTKYMNNDNSKKIYFCDLGNKLNEKYYNVKNDNISNPKANSINDLDFGDLTLLKIKKGTITEYLEDFESIKKELK